MRNLVDMQYSEIESKAEEIVKKYYPDNIQGVDVVKMAKEMGFLVGSLELDDNEDGFIIVNDKNIPELMATKFIGVNSRRSPEEKTFIIAHELGHYIFERDNKKSIYAHREHARGNSDAENEVDYFAACLLMPRDSFKKRYESLKSIYADNKENIIAELSLIFGVSRDSIVRRIDEIGAVANGQSSF